jgi:hypothetical protein
MNIERLYIEVDELAQGKVVVNVGKHGGYIMIETVPTEMPQDKLVLVTAFDDIGNVVFEQELDLAVNDIDVETLPEEEATNAKV